MAISYKKLWKLLIDKDMTAVDLRLATGIAPNTKHKHTTINELVVV